MEKNLHSCRCPHVKMSLVLRGYLLRRRRIMSITPVGTGSANICPQSVDLIIYLYHERVILTILYVGNTFLLYLRTTPLRHYISSLPSSLRGSVGQAIFRVRGDDSAAWQLRQLNASLVPGKSVQVRHGFGFLWLVMRARDFCDG